MNRYSLSQMGGLALVVAAFGHSFPIFSQEIGADSRVIDLSQLAQGDEAKARINGLQEAAAAVRTAAKEARDKIKKAKEDFDANPTPEKEAQLVRANAEGVAQQFKSLGAYREAALKAAGALEGVLKDIGQGKEAFDKQNGKLSQDEITARGAATEAEEKLMALAARLPELLDAQGRLDPALDAAVTSADWIRRQYDTLGRMAADEKATAQEELKNLEHLQTHLAKKRTDLDLAMKASGAVQGTLAMVARWQAEALERRGVLDRGVEILAGLKKSGILEELPNIIYAPTTRRTGDRGLPWSLEEPQQSIEILKRLVTKETVAKKPE